MQQAGLKFMLVEGIPTYKPASPPRGWYECEDLEQKWLFDWAKAHTGKYPALAQMYHIPNGGKRGKATAGRLKAMGVQAGVPDICLPCPFAGYMGLYLELKVDDKTPSDKQKEWLRALAAQGYYACVCYGWNMAADVIEAYLQGMIRA